MVLQSQLCRLVLASAFALVGPLALLLLFRACVRAEGVAGKPLSTGFSLQSADCDCQNLCGLREVVKPLEPKISYQSSPSSPCFNNEKVAIIWEQYRYVSHPLHFLIGAWLSLLKQWPLFGRLDNLDFVHQLVVHRPLQDDLNNGHGRPPLSGVGCAVCTSDIKDVLAFLQRHHLDSNLSGHLVHRKVCVGHVNRLRIATNKDGLFFDNLVYKFEVLGRGSTTHLSIAWILEEISDLAIGSLVFIFGMDLPNDQSFFYIRSVYGDEVIVA